MQKLWEAPFGFFETQPDFACDWTLANSLSLSGVGVHTGQISQLEIQPSETPGFWLQRQGQLWPLNAAQVRDTRFCTTLGPAADPVMTLEHVLAALYGLGISAAILSVAGPEAPILDGSAWPVVEAILSTGIRVLTSPRQIWQLQAPWQQAGLCLQPAAKLQIHYSIDFARSDTRLQQERSFVWSPLTFAQEIAPARTFAFEGDLDRMRAQGLVKGGSFENALVLSEAGQPLNGLRFADEPVRHKILDCLGDLALLGGWLQAGIEIQRGGHSAHVTMVKTLKEQGLLRDERNRRPARHPSD